MLLTGYRKEIFRPECNPQFQSLHCIAYLNEDIAAVLPYLNAVLGGHQYLKEPPSLTLKVHGKLITLHPREIAVNALAAAVGLLFVVFLLVSHFDSSSLRLTW